MYPYGTDFQENQEASISNNLDIEQKQKFVLFSKSKDRTPEQKKW